MSSTLEAAGGAAKQGGLQEEQKELVHEHMPAADGGGAQPSASIENERLPSGSRKSDKKRFRCTIEYDGTDFSGFQSQGPKVCSLLLFPPSLPVPLTLFCTFPFPSFAS
jgi:hypothetical protein